MRRRALVYVVVAGLAAGAGFLAYTFLPFFHRGEKAAVAAIERLGGTAEPSADAPDGPITQVNLTATACTDEDLKVLTDLPHLQALWLTGTGVTDAGLASLEGLKSLETLSLAGTSIGDVGLEHLTGLTNLRELDLTHTRVTGAGLKHLTGLTDLRRLAIGGTEIDYQGKEVRELRQALPQLRIEPNSF
jgi:hypothetical protein